MSLFALYWWSGINEPWQVVSKQKTVNQAQHVRDHKRLQKYEVIGSLFLIAKATHLSDEETRASCFIERILSRLKSKA